MIQKFESGAVLYTGSDMIEAFERSMNRRDNYDHKSCSFCMYAEGSRDECDGCSVVSMDGCSCHINPPCSFCVNNHFEVSPYLINYQHYKSGGKWKWECFKSTKKVFDRLCKLEKIGLTLNAETLSTGEISICVSSDDDDVDIVLSSKRDFKKKTEELILKFK